MGCYNKILGLFQFIPKLGFLGLFSIWVGTSCSWRVWQFLAIGYSQMKLFSSLSTLVWTKVWCQMSFSGETTRIDPGKLQKLVLKNPQKPVLYSPGWCKEVFPHQDSLLLYPGLSCVFQFKFQARSTVYAINCHY